MMNVKTKGISKPYISLPIDQRRGRRLVIPVHNFRRPAIYDFLP